MIENVRLPALKRYRFLWLMLALVFCLIMTPLEDLGHFALFTNTVLFAIVVVTAVIAATDNRAHLISAIVLAILWILGILFGSVLGQQAHIVSADLVLICLLFFVTYVILRPVLLAKETDFNLLCGAIGVYLLIAIAWAQSHDVIERLAPGSFDVGAGADMGWSASLYFSLTTLTTLDYGDITPTSAGVGIWATSEALFGQLYIAVLIARTLALFRV